MYLKALQLFLSIMFNKREEYLIGHRKFNPIKTFTVGILVLNVFFSVYLTIKLNDAYIYITTKCNQEDLSPQK